MIIMKESWKSMLEEELESGYFYELREKLEEEKQKYPDRIVPEDKKIYHAFNLFEPQSLKVVIVGQNPYPKEGDAHGLAFSVPREGKLPGSLKNIFKVVAEDFKLKEVPVNGNLERWARQGVLLLNRVLTTRDGHRHAHKGFGWENFTEEVIKKVSQEHCNIVFMLWGNKAKKLKKHICEKRHKILETSHPSPLSARLGFLNCGHFKKANEYLKSNNIEPIDWK